MLVIPQNMKFHVPLRLCPYGTPLPRCIVALPAHPGDRGADRVRHHVMRHAGVHGAALNVVGTATDYRAFSAQTYDECQEVARPANGGSEVRSPRSSFRSKNSDEVSIVPIAF